MPDFHRPREPEGCLAGAGRRAAQGGAGALLLALALIVLAGCSARDQLVRYGPAVGLRKPYSNTAEAGSPQAEAYDRLVRAVEALGGDILVADRASGLLSWIDTGYAFHLPQTLKVRIEHPSKSPFVDTPLSTWHGIVHASARVKPTARDVRVYVKAVSRDETNNQVCYSDGHFESLLLRQLGGTPAAEKPPGGAEDRPGPSSVPSPGRPRGGGTPRPDYWELYFDHFRSLPPVAGPDILARGFRQTVPAPSGDVWEACLDVVWQYDGIAYLSPNERVVVFARSMSWMDKSDKKDGAGTRFVDVLFAVTLKDLQAGGTQLAVCWLEPPGMVWKSPLPEGTPDKASAAGPRGRKECAADLAWQFVAELATQLSWRDRLLGKFQAGR